VRALSSVDLDPGYATRCIVLVVVGYNGGRAHTPSLVIGRSLRQPGLHAGSLGNAKRSTVQDNPASTSSRSHIINNRTSHETSRRSRFTTSSLPASVSANPEQTRDLLIRRQVNLYQIRGSIATLALSSASSFVEGEGQTRGGDIISN
jgi:hypothetical protein